jgi:hypothetical protein
LDLRIDKLVKSQYTKQKATQKDLLRPIHLDKKKPNLAIEYMIERTPLRPRDLIQFFNLCIMFSDEKPMIDANNLINAEGNYSRQRFRVLVDEWVGIYPNLELLAGILRNRKPSFRVKDSTLTNIEQHCLKSATLLEAVSGDDYDEMESVVDGKTKP